MIKLAADEDIEPSGDEEVSDAIERLKNYKAPGIDDLLADLQKYGGESLVKALHNLITLRKLSRENGEKR